MRLAQPGRRHARELQLLAAGLAADPEELSREFDILWDMQRTAAHRGAAWDWPALLRQLTARLGIEHSDSACAELLARMEAQLAAREVCTFAGAREVLGALRAAGVRTALICDTGFSSGRVVRRLLERLELATLLEIMVFSDEVGVSKPHRRMFTTAMSALGVSADGALHVGDRRRCDVAGARGVGMATVRFCGDRDDADAERECAALGCTPACVSPEADHVVASYAALAALLGVHGAVPVED